jgi:nitrate reductase gamma subunit
MQQFFINFFFGIYPYIAATVFVVGCIARLRYSPYTWRTGSSQLLRKKSMRIGSNFFHIGILLLFLGHLFGLLTPESLYTLAISVPHKQLLAMIAGGTFGTICFIGLTILVIRRLGDSRVRATSSFSDIFILLLLYIQLMLGLSTIAFSAQDLSGHNMEMLAYWAQHLVTFQGDAAHFLTNVDFIFKLHIFLGLTVFLVFPFTRLVHIISAPIWYLIRPGYQVVKKRPRTNG